MNWKGNEMDRVHLNRFIKHCLLFPHLTPNGYLLYGSVGESKFNQSYSVVNNWKMREWKSRFKSYSNGFLSPVTDPRKRSLCSWNKMKPILLSLAVSHSKLNALFTWAFRYINYDAAKEIVQSLPCPPKFT